MVEIKKKDTDINGFIQGQAIEFFPLNSNHVKLYFKWVNDAKIRRLSRHGLPSMLESKMKDLDKLDEKQSSEISFEIWHKSDKKPIGFCKIHHISWLDRRAEIGFTIGEQEYWGKGLATETVKLLLDYCFKELNFHKVAASSAVPNIGSWKVSEKNGMKREATIRDFVYVDGEYLDAYLYSILKDEWFEFSRSHMKNFYNFKKKKVCKT